VTPAQCERVAIQITDTFEGYELVEPSDGRTLAIARSFRRGRPLSRDRLPELTATMKWRSPSKLDHDIVLGDCIRRRVEAVIERAAASRMCASDDEPRS
jgi:hypothetical protein